MMPPDFYSALTTRSLNDEPFSQELCRRILTDPELDLLPLLFAAYEVRRRFFDNRVTLHIINNAQNGHCPEDCNYCAQAKTSAAGIAEYPMKPESEILAEAKAAYESGAFRYCLVFAGRGPSDRRTEKLAALIREIKSRYPLEVCVSPGITSRENLQKLKDAGLDRLNHNLNTSEARYPSICSTHTYQDRMQTLLAARETGLAICSGIIAGMGESVDDVIQVARELSALKAESIPVNFLVPVPGNRLTVPKDLHPRYCLRILCLYRFLNPRAELRASAGREGHLRSMEVLCLYPANSIFVGGYLNTRGSERRRVLRMIQDAGFEIESDDFDVKSLLAGMDGEGENEPQFTVDGQAGIVKSLDELRPQSTPSS